MKPGSVSWVVFVDTSDWRDADVILHLERAAHAVRWQLELLRVNTVDEIHVEVSEQGRHNHLAC